MKKLSAFFTPARRRYFYTLSITIVAAAGTLGYITEEAAPQIIAIVGALLAITTASANVPNEDAKNDGAIVNDDPAANAQEATAAGATTSTATSDTEVDSYDVTVAEDYNYDDYEGGQEVMDEAEQKDPEPVTDEDIEAYDESDGLND